MFSSRAFTAISGCSIPVSISVREVSVSQRGVSISRTGRFQVSVMPPVPVSVMTPVPEIGNIIHQL